MPDSIQPVGAMIKPPDINQGLNTMSSLLGIQQQRQNLQTGQYAQATAQADSQQAQQRNAELQGAAKIAQQAYTSGRYKNGDGTFNQSKMADDISALGPYAQAMAKDVTSRAGEVYRNQQTYFNLETSKQQRIADTIGSLASDPQIDHEKVTTGLDNLRHLYPDDKDVSRMLQSLGGAISPQLSGPQLQQALNSMASSLKGVSAIGGTTNAQSQIVNRGTYSGQLTAAGTPTAAEAGSDINPSSPKVAGAAAAATTRAAGSGNTDIDTSKIVIAAQKNAKANIDLTRRIDQLADIVNPGSLPAKVSAGLGALGLQNVVQARSELKKDLGNLQANYTDRAGSDERARTILSGLPTDETPTQTIHQAMDRTRGSARQDLALGQIREKNDKATNGNMNGFSSQYAHATGAASPLMHEYWSLPKAEQAQFLKRNSSSPQQAQALRNEFEAARGQLNVGQ